MEMNCKNCVNFKPFQSKMHHDGECFIDGIRQAFVNYEWTCDMFESLSDNITSVPIECKIEVNKDVIKD